jgi:uncharacterized SAM-binding protein YcdF (DUF218 family)
VTRAATSHRRTWNVLACSVVLFLLLVAATLRWGGYLLVKNDALPSHADGAVILQSSLVSENARIAGAIRLLQQGVVNHILLSIPETGFWGQSLPSLARGYLEKQYGRDIAARFEFCITGPGVDSTEQEAEALIPCIENRDWHSIIVVTSNFHSRRAGMIWRRAWKSRQLPLLLSVDGVQDPSFAPAGWWRHRLYAKTWFFETTKLIWSLVFR